MLFNRIKLYRSLIKPGITNMQLITVSIGFVLSANGVLHLLFVFVPLLLGTWLTSAGACALNHAVEISVDKKMNRTQSRPLPSGQLTRLEVLLFGCLCVGSGLFIHFYWTTVLTTLLSALTVFFYVGIYTPLKRYSWLNTWVGAIPGAMPILGGWAAVVGVLQVEAAPLFLVLFFWQHPHFYGLATMYQGDYAKADLRMLPVVEPDLTRTKRQSLIYTVLMIISSYLLFLFYMVGVLYLLGSVLINGLMLFYAVRFYKQGSVLSARHLFLSSIAYLPLWFVLILCDRLFFS